MSFIASQIYRLNKYFIEDKKMLGKMLFFSPIFEESMLNSISVTMFFFKTRLGFFEVYDNKATFNIILFF